MRVFAFLCAAALVSCHTGSSNTVSGALIMTSIALGTSVANRAAGSCYAVCQQGERCNEKSGMCEGLPCRGQCMAGETCEEGFFGVRCLPNASLAVSASQREPPPPPPAPEETLNTAVPDAAKP
jgi:hypothetical protein